MPSSGISTGSRGTAPTVASPDVPEEPTTVRDLLERRAAELGDRTFAVVPDATLSYRDLDDLADRFALALLGLGVAPGDVVMVRAVNGWASLASWFGCNKLGAVYLPLNALLTGAPLRQVMAHSRGRIVIVDHALVADIEAVRAALPDLATVVVAGAPAGATVHPRLEDLLDSASGAVPPLTADLAAPTKLMYTSGTTGVPKGVLWSRNCELVWARSYGDELLPIERDEALYCCLPLFHVTCQGTVLAALWRGGRITVDRGFELLSFWRRIRDADAVMFTFVGTILSGLARRPPTPADTDHRVRRVLGAAAPIDRWRQIEDRFGLQIAETWGQTETASCWSWPARGLPQEPGTVGVPSARWDARIVDDAGGDCAPGQPGELWIQPRQDHVMFEGYLGDGGPTQPTRESWTEDGWYRTGDLLKWTDDGELAFVGRERDAIRRAGEMIAPSFIEEAAITHPQVGEAAAIGVGATDGVEEEVLLCVVPVEGVAATDVDPAAIAAHLATELPAYLVPRWLRVLEELPKTPTTRVRKFELRALGTAGAWDVRRKRLVEPD